MNHTAVVAYLGSSSVAGKGQAFDWIGELARRPGNSRFHFRKFGAGGDLAYNALQRLPKVLACRPNTVVVWVGGNDVLASVTNKARRFFRFLKRNAPKKYSETIKEVAREEGISYIPVREAMRRKFRDRPVMISHPFSSFRFTVTPSVFLSCAKALTKSLESTAGDFIPTASI